MLSVRERYSLSLPGIVAMACSPYHFAYNLYDLIRSSISGNRVHLGEKWTRMCSIPLNAAASISPAVSTLAAVVGIIKPPMKYARMFLLPAMVVATCHIAGAVFGSIEAVIHAKRARQQTAFLNNLNTDPSCAVATEEEIKRSIEILKSYLDEESNPGGLQELSDRVSILWAQKLKEELGALNSNWQLPPDKLQEYRDLIENTKIQAKKIQQFNRVSSALFFSLAVVSILALSTCPPLAAVVMFAAIGVLFMMNNAVYYGSIKEAGWTFCLGDSLHWTIAAITPESWKKLKWTYYEQQMPPIHIASRAIEATGSATEHSVL